MNKCRSFITGILHLACSSISQGQPATKSSDWKSYLDKITGMWNLTADMGSRELNQQCEGEWVLQQQFLRVQCEAVAPDSSLYESIYFITYNSKENHYAFHLLDLYQVI